MVVQDRRPLLIGEQERVACERLRQDGCAGKPPVVAQFLPGDRGVEEDLGQAQRHPHPHRLGVGRVSPVGVVVA
jgi:hypothetical protein